MPSQSAHSQGHGEVTVGKLYNFGHMYSRQINMQFPIRST